MTGRCPECGRPFDRPGFYERCAGSHPAPTPAQQIAEDVEREIHGRKGLGWDHLDDDIVDEIRDSLADVIARRLRPAEAAPDLLAACEDAYRVLAEVQGMITIDRDPGSQECLDCLVAAIRKARGEDAMLTLKLWVENQPTDHDCTAHYLDGAPWEEPPGVTLDGGACALRGEDPEEVWAAFLGLREAVADLYHDEDDGGLADEELGPPSLVACTPEEWAGGDAALANLASREARTYAEWAEAKGGRR